MIDEIDNKLMLLLEADGRQSLMALAGRMGVSIHTVARRLERLIRDQVIRVVGTVDIEKVGAPLSVLVCLQLEPGTIETTINELGRHPCVFAIQKTMGRFNILLSMWFHSTRDLARFLLVSLPGIPGVKISDTSVILNIVKSLGTRLSPYFIESEDRDLIALLQEDGRRSNASTATALGISPSTVGRRIRQLLASGTIRISLYRYIPRPEARVGALVRISVELSRMASAITELANHPQVVSVSICTGQFDIIARVYAESTENLSDFIATHVNSIPGVVEVEYSLILETHSFYDSRHREYWNGENRPEQSKDVTFQPLVPEHSRRRRLQKQA